MSKHRFHVGELVRTEVSVSVPVYEVLMGPGIRGELTSERPCGIYEVIKLLSELPNGEPQYRIRCDGEPERVILESQLTPAVHQRAPRKPVERLQAVASVRQPSRRGSAPTAS